MTNKEKILRDLSVSQTTADSMAPRVDMPVEAVKTVLAQLIAQGAVETLLINDYLTTYRLTSGLPTTRQP